MKHKIRILHLWKNDTEAKRLIAALSRTGIDFEARLVKTELDFVSSLLRNQFDIVIVDKGADFPRNAGGDQLSALEIVRQTSGPVPFLLIGERDTLSNHTETLDDSVFILPGHELDGLESLVRKALAPLTGNSHPKKEDL